MIRLQSALDILFLSMIAIVVGYLVGWQIGALRDVHVRRRIALAVVASLTGGPVLAILMSPLTFSSVFYLLETVAAMTTGLVLGAVTHWSPSTPAPYRPHVVYEPDTDEEFDREIERALRGKEEPS